MELGVPVVGKHLGRGEKQAGNFKFFGGHIIIMNYTPPPHTHTHFQDYTIVSYIQ